MVARVFELVFTDSTSASSQLIEIRASGSLQNHYAPAAKVILDSMPQSGQGLKLEQHLSSLEQLLSSQLL